MVLDLRLIKLHIVITIKKKITVAVRENDN